MTAPDAASANGRDDALLRVIDLTKHFPIVRGAMFARRTEHVHAVDGVSFAVAQGEALGLVGESGCGKSTIGRMLVRLLPPTAGRIVFDGIDLATLPTSQIAGVIRNLQIIFQDPFSSLNPRMRVGGIISEPMRIAGGFGRDDIRARVLELLDDVGLASEHIDRFPHEFSGGQRQRIAIARALALHPRFLVADECVSALDISVKAQILELLRNLKQKLGLTFVFISHDLSAVRFLCDRICVLYLGQIVEIAAKAQFFAQPSHPYSRALLSAVPGGSAVGRARQRIVLGGEVPSPLHPPSGCRFHTRCPEVQQICREVMPPLRRASDGRSVACHLVPGVDEAAKPEIVAGMQ